MRSIATVWQCVLEENLHWPSASLLWWYMTHLTSRKLGFVWKISNDYTESTNGEMWEIPKKMWVWVIWRLMLSFSFFPAVPFPVVKRGILAIKCENVSEQFSQLLQTSHEGREAQSWQRSWDLSRLSSLNSHSSKAFPGLALNESESSHLPCFVCWFLQSLGTLKTHVVAMCILAHAWPQPHVEGCAGPSWFGAGTHSWNLPLSWGVLITLDVRFAQRFARDWTQGPVHARQLLCWWSAYPALGIPFYFCLMTEIFVYMFCLLLMC